MSDETETPINKSAKSFAHVLATLEGGVFNDQLSSAVQDLIGDMSNHAALYGGNAKGKIDLSIELTLKNGVFEILAGKKLTHPKDKKSQSIFWADKDNNLTEENPRQRKFDFDSEKVAPLKNA